MEHIFPEALVGKRSWDGTGPAAPHVLPELTLANGEVCSECNGRLSKIDAKLTEALGVLRVFWNETGTKRGTPASAFRPGMYAVRREEGPHIVVNAEAHAILSEDGTRIAPAKGAHALTLREEQVGDRHMLHCSQPITIGKHFVQAIHKIGFETLCLRKGQEFVLQERFDVLRSYIVYGKGSRSLLVPPLAPEEERKPVPELPSVDIERAALSPMWSARVTLGVPMLVDLTSEQAFPWVPPLRYVSDKKPKRMYFTFTLPLTPVSRATDAAYQVTAS